MESQTQALSSQDLVKRSRLRHLRLDREFKAERNGVLDKVQQMTEAVRSVFNGTVPIAQLHDLIHTYWSPRHTLMCELQNVQELWARSSRLNEYVDARPKRAFRLVFLTEDQRAWHIITLVFFCSVTGRLNPDLDAVQLNQILRSLKNASNDPEGTRALLRSNPADLDD